MKCLYYPGCSQKAASRPYEQAFLAICPKLGIEPVELDDWNCCGTTAVISINKILSLALAARNLAIAEPLGLPVVTPCPSCWLSLSKVNWVLEDGGRVADQVRDALSAGNLEYKGTARVRHIMEFLVNEVGLEKVQEAVSSPLTGLRIAPYYGCQVVRPYAEGDDADNPQNMETIIGALGGEVTDFPLRTSCCGGALMLTDREQAEKMTLEILESTREAGADLVVTPCGLCQVNLELAGRASKSAAGDRPGMPALNIAQLMGLAFRISPELLGLDRKAWSQVSEMPRPAA